MYIYQILDWYCASLTFSMVGFFEAVVVVYIYGLNRFCQDAELMFGWQPSWPIRILWMITVPGVLGTMLFIGVGRLQPPTYDYTNYEYPEWAIGMGWAVACVSAAPTPIVFLYVLFTTKGDNFKDVKHKHSYFSFNFINLFVFNNRK